jgi:anti-sigma regulatory factor (Ser/Thr protein kinase)
VSLLQSFAVTSTWGDTAAANRWKGPRHVPPPCGTRCGPDGAAEDPGPARFPSLPTDALSRVLTIPPVPRAVRAARQWVRETLVRWRLTDAVESAESIVSELVTNSIIHAEDGASVVVLLMYAAGALRMEVRDHDPLNLPLVGNPGPLDTSGRGLVLVEALAGRLGVRVTDTGKAVWCELAVSPRIPPRIPPRTAPRPDEGRCHL